jgi:hypothetical protein
MSERLSVGTATLTCEECGRPWLRSFEMWRTYLTDHEPPQPVTYCPDCAHREFDPLPPPAAEDEQAAVVQTREKQARAKRIRVLLGGVRHGRWSRYALVAALAVSVLGNVLAATQ